uniref:Stress-activated protein kinase JNK n=1 Tax=Parascaris univalens TaxID=6257 RepID=A0A915A759_PARUN
MSFDTKNFHQIRVESRAGTSVFTVPKRYTNLSFISAGAQGTVVRADDLVTNEPVAIKKVQHPFLTPMNAKRTYREFVLLVTMQHPNLISLKSAFTPQSSLRDFEEIYLVMELMNYNLSQVIRQLKLDHKNLSYFTYQMIVAMKYMHRSGIIHRDLKPSNIVVNDKCILKILDFGLARKMETNERMSIYVVTRHYRAPEVILGLPYTEKVDIWAIGCILAEMILRRILFPGTDRLDQWTKITSVLGTPSKEFIDRLEHHARLFVRSKGRTEPKSFEEIFPDDIFVGHFPNAPQLCAKNARDLLSKMLQIDPEKRISIDEAVQHPYVKLWFIDSEWNAPLPENRYDPQNDLVERPIEQWRELVFNEVKQYEQNHDIHGVSRTQTAV